MENESGFEKELDEQAAEKGGPEKMIISKTWHFNWDDILVGWLKRLFNKDK